MIQKNETVLLGWCDNGLVDGRFTEGVFSTFLSGPSNGIVISSIARVEGNQIGRQRQALFDFWADSTTNDWLLWIDSDIRVTSDVLKKLWDAADKDSCQVISGTYFISKETDGSLLVPYPVLFNNIEEFKVQYLHPLPKDQIVKCDCAGMGLVLMHRSIIPVMRKKYPNESMFAEQEGTGERFVSEDIVFFRKLKNAGIQLYAHTGAIPTHMKRFSLDADYYNLYWNSKA